MLRSVKSLKQMALGARDGRIGHVREFYFDDQRWTIRYLVAQAGNWLTGQMVLISPFALGGPDDAEHALHVNLTRDQIRNSPSPETDRPVSRQFELDYYRYFGWPYYWVGPYLWGPSPYPALPGSEVTSEFPPVEGIPREPKGDPHLRSTDEMTGYHIRAHDGEIGHIEDFLFDDRDWSIHYLVVDTRNWWPGKRVLVPVSWFGEIRWEDRTMDAEASRNDIKAAPAFDPSKPITQDFEDKLTHYYETHIHQV